MGLYAQPDRIDTLDIDAGRCRARAELHLHKPAREYAQAVLGQLCKARFLENALLKVVRTVPSDLRFDRDVSGIEGITVENDNSS